MAEAQLDDGGRQLLNKTRDEAQATFVRQQAKPAATPTTPPAPAPRPPAPAPESDEPVIVQPATPAPAGEVIPPRPTPSPAQVEAAVARVDRREVRPPEIRRIVDAGLADVARAGRELPRAVRISRPSTSLTTETPVIFAPAQPQAIIVNTRWPRWPDAAAAARSLHEARTWSTPEAAHPVYASIARQQLHAIVGGDRYAQLVGMDILRFVTLTERALIESAVSTTAVTSSAAFIAEIYAMLIAGRPVPRELLALYQRLGGT
jgi:hypothetical protein